MDIIDVRLQIHRALGDPLVSSTYRGSLAVLLALAAILTTPVAAEIFGLAAMDGLDGCDYRCGGFRFVITGYPQSSFLDWDLS